MKRVEISGLRLGMVLAVLAAVAVAVGLALPVPHGTGPQIFANVDVAHG